MTPENQIGTPTAVEIPIMGTSPRLLLGQVPWQIADSARQKYAVDVQFIKDGTPLHVANPHLIVTKIGDQ